MKTILKQIFKVVAVLGIVTGFVLLFITQYNSNYQNKLESSSLLISEHFEISQMPSSHESGIDLKTQEFSLQGSVRTLIKAHSFFIRHQQAEFKQQFKINLQIAEKVFSIEQKQGFYLYTLRKLLI